MSDALARLSELGVSVWLDDLSRERMDSGNLETLIRDRHVVGVTTNPTIFAAALAKGDAYDEQVSELAEAGTHLEDAVFGITTSDVRRACDLMRPVWESTDRLDGRVSIEVDPRLARDTQATIDQARQLWTAVDRPNLMVKIPATEEGLPAITAALGDGISVNVTLIFSLNRYRAVMNAFLSGLEAAQQAGRDLSAISSVASFFVSRVDTEVDRRLDEIGTAAAKKMRGKAAIANARLAYQAYEEVFATSRWDVLADDGARPQRPLWASTGVKDPSYPDTMYVTELVAPNTVNTMPEKTMDAVADHGEITGDTVRGRYAEAAAVLDELEALGVSYASVTAALENEGVEKFEKSWSELLSTVSDELARSASADSPAEAGQ
jgi:transaldolase